MLDLFRKSIYEICRIRYNVLISFMRNSFLQWSEDNVFAPWTSTSRHRSLVRRPQASFKFYNRFKASYNALER
jgi:hypothetical protein